MSVPCHREVQLAKVPLAGGLPMAGGPIVSHPISQRSSYKVDGLRQLPSIHPEILQLHGFTAEGAPSSPRYPHKHAFKLCPSLKGILSPGWLPGGKGFYKVT